MDCYMVRSCDWFSFLFFHSFTIHACADSSCLFVDLCAGFSWDGAPSLAPALAVASWRGNIAFLLAYALGTMGAMAVTTTLIGEGTRQAGAIFQRPDLPQKLSFFSSLIAIIVGGVWTGLAFV